MMFNILWSRCALLTLALSLGFLVTKSASADVNITFMELANEGGIRVFGNGFDGAAFDVTKPDSETFGISSPAVPGGYSPDLILSHIGISRSSGGYLFALTETLGGPVSDYVWVHQFVSAFTVIDFVSDSEFPLVLPTTADAIFVETGGIQAIGGYNNDRGERVNIFVQSDVGVVPEPETYALMLAGLGLLGFVARRRKQKAA